MGYYIRRMDGTHPQVWKIDDRVAVLVDVTNPERGAGTYFEARPGETIWDAIRRQSPFFEPDGQNPFHETILGPGEYYRRIARPLDARPHDALGWNPSAKDATNFIAISRGQLIALTRQLDRICQTVHPTEETFRTFGHDIRNVLILACTEAEAHWRGVLVANGVTKKHCTTNDYVALRDAMKLDEYAVSFPNYPWLPALKPYEGWRSSGSPTDTLPWYTAYNAVKHNRENEFERATLLRAFEAVSACVIMLAAQFGLPMGLGKGSELQAFFHLSMIPMWPLTDLYLMPRSEAGDWVPVNFPFQTSRG